MDVGLQLRALAALRVDLPRAGQVFGFGAAGIQALRNRSRHIDLILCSANGRCGPVLHRPTFRLGADLSPNPTQCLTKGAGDADGTIPVPNARDALGLLHGTAGVQRLQERFRLAVRDA